MWIWIIAIHYGDNVGAILIRTESGLKFVVKFIEYHQIFDRT